MGKLHMLVQYGFFIGLIIIFHAIVLLTFMMGILLMFLEENISFTLYAALAAFVGQTKLLWMLLHGVVRQLNFCFEFDAAPRVTSHSCISLKVPNKLSKSDSVSWLLS